MSVCFDGEIHDVQRKVGAKSLRRIGPVALVLTMLASPVLSGTLGQILRNLEPSNTWSSCPPTMLR